MRFYTQSRFGSSLFRVGESGAAVVHSSVSEQRRANASRFAAKSVSVRRAVPREFSLLAAPLKSRRKAPAVPLVLSHRPPRRLSDACRQTPSVGITLTNSHSQAAIRTPRLYPLGIARSLTILQPFVFTKTGASDRETQKRLLATAVEVEKLKLSWRARYQ